MANIVISLPPVPPPLGQFGQLVPIAPISNMQSIVPIERGDIDEILLRQSLDINMIRSNIPSAAFTHLKLLLGVKVYSPDAEIFEFILNDFINFTIDNILEYACKNSLIIYYHHMVQSQLNLIVKNYFLDIPKEKYTKEYRTHLFAASVQFSTYLTFKIQQVAITLPIPFQNPVSSSTSTSISTSISLIPSSSSLSSSYASKYETKITSIHSIPSSSSSSSSSSSLSQSAIIPSINKLTQFDMQVDFVQPEAKRRKKTVRFQDENCDELYMLAQVAISQQFEK